MFVFTLVLHLRLERLAQRLQRRAQLPNILILWEHRVPEASPE